jgi:choline dehydrogenase-like flavoprotein
MLERQQCGRSSPHPTAAAGARRRYCIVGAGSAGCVLAARLSEDPDNDVQLLEAGPDLPKDASDIPDDVRHLWGSAAGIITINRPDRDWMYTASATSANHGSPLPRGRILGGSSSVNSGLFLRGQPEDFDRWHDELGCTGWGWVDVLPYYRRLESDHEFGHDTAHHSSEGPVPVSRYSREELRPDQKAWLAAAASLGFEHTDDANHPRSTGTSMFPLNVKERVRQSAAVTHLLPARRDGRPNLCVRTGVTVERLAFDDRAGQPRCTGVLLSSGESLAADEVVIAAGAIGSPQLLLQSGIGPYHELQELGLQVVVDSPGVGQNLRDHPGVAVDFTVPDSASALADDEDSYPQQVLLRYTSKYSRHRNGKIGMLSRCACTRVANLQSIHVADMIIYLGCGRKVMTGAGNDGQRVYFLRPTINLAASAGMITLDPASESGLRIELGMLSHPHDRRRLREGVRLCRKTTIPLFNCVCVCRLANLKSINIAVRIVERAAEMGLPVGPRLVPSDAELDSDVALDQYLLRTATTGHHPCGTCAMGTWARDAVVDPEGRVFGVVGLRVVDASAMPDCPRANLNATTMMMAEKLAAEMRPAAGGEELSGRVPAA